LIAFSSPNDLQRPAVLPHISDMDERFLEGRREGILSAHSIAVIPPLENTPPDLIPLLPFPFQSKKVNMVKRNFPGYS